MKARALIATLCLGVLFTSCLGANPTTNTLRNWNRTVTENEWGNVAIGLVAVPAQLVTYAVDVTVFNSWKFWTGDDLWCSDPGAYAGTGK